MCLISRNCYPNEACIRYAFDYRYGYNKETEKCEEFTFGGCKGNENSFMSIEECSNTCGEGGISRDMCLLPRAPGPCKDSMAKWLVNYSL